ncbi:MAG: arginine--tRNA ligase [Clostridia bacterium]|nr:arginine--tRNA ligase [Clostridia bacterium]
MIEIKKQIAEALSAAAGGAIDAVAVQDALEYPPNADMGDLAFPCFRLSKVMRKAPPAIAAELSAAFSCPAVERVEVAGGYLNLFLNKAYLAEYVIGKAVFADKPYGSSEEGKGKTVVLDYSSPNVAKPFHIGHLGTTVIGHSLKKLHEFAGYHCIGINHLGDWGTQFGKLITAYRLWGDKEKIERDEIDELVALYVKFHAEAEKDDSLNDKARAEFKKLEDGDEENLALWKWFIEISLREYQKTYALLDISFDSYNGESFYTDKMAAQVEKIRAAGLLKIDDGASIVDLEEYGMPPCLILKRDGSTLYPTRDIAAAVYRKNTYDFDKCIYVTSAGQSLHFAQWFKVVELMGYDWADKLVHVPYGTVSIDGAKLATRTGNVVLLKDLFATAIDKSLGIIEEKNPDLENKEDVAKAVGVGAVVFHYLSGGRIKDMNFIMEDALSFDGNTGPYAQYTYARTCSILRRAGEPAAVAAKITTDEESELVKVLLRFPEKVKSAIDDYEPSTVTRYALDLCAAFNRFYHECPILNCEDADIRATRLCLVSATKNILGNALHLICVGTPEKI